MKKLLIIDARMIGPFGHGISKYVEGIAESLKDGDALTDLLVEWAKIDPKKIKVFYNRFSAPATVGAEKTKAILDRYHLKPHKNTEMLISAH
jgi:hypothetical protein